MVLSTADQLGFGTWKLEVHRRLQYDLMVMIAARLAFAWLVGTALSAAAEPGFEQDVVPILTRHCLQCHSDAVKMGELDLRTPEAMLHGGSKGPALVRGSAETSLLYQRIIDRTMPMGPKKVPDTEAKIIREWIDSGADSGPAAAQTGQSKKRGEHWAFQPPERPAVPTVKNQAWVRTPVDAFLMKAMESKGIGPVAPADRPALLRRAYLGLIGLPPTPAEQKVFLADRSPTAWDKVVEDLLSRPQYGERWARRWLDVVRYAESNGYERDGTKPNAWRYRDYVIQAFNSDKPYNRFIMEQLAGDEMEGSSAETQIATTFLRLGTWDDEPAEPQLDRYDQLDDVLGVTATAFLGVTLRCARCHDHKFEPFSQKDYYRTLAIFTPLKRPQDDRKDLDRLVGTEAELTAYLKSKEKADAEVAEREKQLEEARRAVMRRMFAAKDKARGEDVAWLRHAEVVLAFSTPAGRRNKEQKKLVEEFNSRLEEEILKEAETPERNQIETARSEIAAIDGARSPEPPRAYIWYEESAEAPATKLLERGDPVSLGEEVQPGVPEVLGSAEPVQIQPTRKSTGRRLWLARWLTREDHPLTARVIVNRIWQGYFGEGLVASENDFGVMGQRPTHADLLDYLATELVASGWSLKHIHRLIVMSSAYRLSAAWDEKRGKADPENTLLWRWKPRRLEAEAIRDGMLAVSGKLTLKMGGPSIFPDLPRAVLEGQSRPGDGWGKSDSQEAARRSVYIFSKRSLAVPELEVMDAPDTTSSCEQRTVSTTGPQALTFLNGDFTGAQARAFAERLEREAGNDADAQIGLAFTLAYGRAPNPEERHAVREFLVQQERQIEAGTRDNRTPRQRALEGFALVLLNGNEFFYLN
ncbi:MAG: DUF1553 domain-containing protein [Bryobacteraceae bacterium]